MKYDIGDIIKFRSIQMHHIIQWIYNIDGVLFYDMECLEDGKKYMFSSKTLDRSFDIVQKVKYDNQDG